MEERREDGLKKKEKNSWIEVWRFGRGKIGITKDMVDILISQSDVKT